MKKISKRDNLQKAKNGKNNEFYTQYKDIEDELKYYDDFLKNKIILANCNDITSQFEQYFINNAERLNLKGLLLYNGDFRDEKAIELLKTADIVITNPPFSLFRQYVKQLIDYDKKFLIIGNINATGYAEIFPLIKANKIWLGSCTNTSMWFGIPSDYPITAKNYKIDEYGRKKIKVSGIRWFTNLEFAKRYEDIILIKKYNETEYPKYENYDAINVDKVSDIPADYYEEMGVPLTFLDKYNPKQFQIIRMLHGKNNFIPIKLEKLKIVSKKGEIGKDITITTDPYINKTSYERNKKILEPKVTYMNDKNEFFIIPYTRIIIKKKNK